MVRESRFLPTPTRNVRQQEPAAAPGDNGSARLSRNVMGSVLLGAGLLGGCALVGPDYERPDLVLPTEWPTELSVTMDGGEEPGMWWQRYEDPVLDSLIERAQLNNLDIELAAARMMEARAELGFRRADRFPSISGFIEAERENPGLTGGSTGSEFVVAGALSYEVDLWGRLARATEGARANLLASAFGRDAIRLAVITDVVASYFEYRAVVDQIQITEDTIVSRQESLRLEQARFRSEEIAELPLRQAEAELQTSRAELPALKAAENRARRTLAILVGDLGAVLSGLEDLGDDGLPDMDEAITDLPDVLPSDLLGRRPDIMAAEAFLVAANADIGVARAEWFPRVDLLAIAGTGATHIGDLFTSNASLYELFGSVTAPILDFGRRQASVSGAEARREIAEVQYRATIMEAFRDVGDAWALVVAADEELEARDLEVQALINVVAAAERRYLGGFTPYIELLDAQRALFGAQLNRTAAARDRLIAMATLYKALGGGWDGPMHGEADRAPDESESSRS